MKFIHLMDIKSLLALFLIITFVLHGIAFTFIGLKRGRSHYLLLTGTFSLLIAIYLIKFEAWTVRVPGTTFPATWLLRIGATIFTLSYLHVIYKKEGTWLWKLAGKGKSRK